MGILDGILGTVASDAGAAVAGANPLSILGKLADDVYTSIFPSPESKATAEAVIAKAKMDSYVAQATIDMQPILAQLDINKVEAASGSMFVAGARPAAMWVGVIGLALYYWPVFLIGEFFWISACIAQHGLAPRPDLGFNDLMGILGPLLGLGSLRTIDKFAGTDTKAIKSK